MRKTIQLIILSLSISGYAQDGSLDMSFNQPTGVTNGDVYAAAVQSDGKIIVGGDFKLLNNTACNKLGRLNADGTIDLSFNLASGFNNTVNGIKIQSDGKIIVVGNFTSYNGIQKNRIVRLNVDGTLDTTFNIGSGANNSVYAAILQADGKILVVGAFSSFNGNLKNRVVRLNVDGTVDSTFNIGTGANNSINSCVVQADSKILIAGDFTSFNGAVRNRIARLNTDGTLDSTFASSGPFNNSIGKVCLQSDGKIVVTGYFTSYSGTSANYIIRLNSDSSIDNTFAIGTGFDSPVNSIIIQADGKLVVGGNFFVYNGSDCMRLVRLNNDGSIDSAFSSKPNFGPNQTINAMVIQSNGKILLGGAFSYYNTFSRNKIVSLNTDGSIDTGFHPFLENGISTDGQIRAVAVQPDGKIIIGGLFNTYRGLPSKNIARLNADGTMDEAFKVGTGTNGIVKKIAVASNNKIIIVGDFKTYNGASAIGVAQLKTDGTLDDAFNSGGSGANNFVNAVSLQTDGRIVIAGDFSTFNGTSRQKLARLNANGTLDNSFTTKLSFPGSIWTTSIQSDGKIIIAGLALEYNGVNVGDIIRLNADGSLDKTFNSGGVGTDYFVYTSSVQADGKIILGGSFNTYNNIPSKALVRLNVDGSLDTSFNAPVFNKSTTLYSSAIQNDGKIIIGGYIPPVATSAGTNIVRLNTDGTLDAAFVTGTGFNSFIMAVAFQSDGKILGGGNFTSYNQIAINYIARLNISNNLGTDYFNYENKITVYPNPVNDYLKFSLPIGVNISDFEVFDVTGRKIDSNKLYTNFLDVSNYSKGIYFLRLKTDKGVLNGKFIKK